MMKMKRFRPVSLVKIRSLSFEDLLSILLLFGCFLLLLKISYHVAPVLLRHDGPYNLQVVDLLARGEGYASYGALRGSGKWLFDPHVTTGPAVLVPLSFVWYFTGGSVLATHLVILFTLWLYVAGLFFLLRDWSAKSALLPVALAVGLTLGVSGIRVNEVLGEMPAMAAIAWAAWAVRRNKPVVASVLAGIAVQMKLIFMIPGIALILIYMVWDFMKNDRIRIVKICIYGLILVSPTLLFELYRFVVMDGVENYLHSIEEFLWFSGNFNVRHVGEWYAPDIIGEKVSTIYKSLHAWSWMACGIFLLFILLWFCFHFRSEKISMAGFRSKTEKVSSARCSSVSWLPAWLSPLYG